MRVLVTGATRGIGEAVARSLARQGWTVAVGGRGPSSVDDARRRIEVAVPGADLAAAPADLALLREVDRLATSLDPLPDAVVANAAVSVPPAVRTDEGLPLVLATNHLAPWHLLRTLAARLGSAPARLVLVAASPTALRRAPVDLDDLEARDERALGPLPSLRPFVAYGRTKNMNVMTAYALAGRLAGSGVTVNAAHPGVIRDTGLGRHATGATRALAAVLDPFVPGPAAGADTPAWLVISPDVAGVTGRCWVRRRPAATAEHTTDPDRCERPWAESERLVDAALAR